MADENQPKSEYKKGYGKRPLWQWILIYVIIGGVIYAGVAYYYVHNHNNNSSTTTNSPY
ncbi:MAG TPA: hypothetical protein VLE72_02275 [Candidatus Saccharimonadales bacterium]|nr:hypothetical protein [Candidatus Saccharimonadales bacterium]